MNTVVLRVVFQTEPSAEVQMTIERRLKSVAKLLAPEVEPELAKGHGSFWIGVTAVAVSVLDRLVVQTASWVWKTYVLDKHLGAMLEGESISGRSPEGLPMARNEEVSEAIVQRKPSDSDQADSPISVKLQQALSDLMLSVGPDESFELRIATLRSDPDSKTGVKGVVCVLRLGERHQGLDLIEVDTKDNFFSLLL